MVQILRKASKFSWDDKCEEIFKQLKDFLTSPSAIQKPRPAQPILVYLAVSDEAVSGALVQEVEGEERPIYFGSRRSTRSRRDTRWSRRWRSPWSSWRGECALISKTIQSLTYYPIFKILSKSDLAGRMIGWLVELSEFDIRYQPQGAIKSQCLVDFSIELTPLPTLSIGWTLYVDGSSNKTACGAEVVLEGSDDLLLEQALHFRFRAINNQVEYEVLLVGLNLAYDMGAREVVCKSDSLVMVGQVKGEFEVKEPLLQRYYHVARNNIARFNKAPLEHIPREENKRVDILSKLSVTKKKSHQRPRHPSVYETKCLAIAEAETDNWMTLIIQYLEDGTCKPEQEKTMKQQCVWYTMINDDLYRKGYSAPCWSVSPTSKPSTS